MKVSFKKPARRTRWISLVLLVVSLGLMISAAGYGYMGWQQGTGFYGWNAQAGYGNPHMGPILSDYHWAASDPYTHCGYSCAGFGDYYAHGYSAYDHTPYYADECGYFCGGFSHATTGYSHAQTGSCNYNSCNNGDSTSININVFNSKGVDINIGNASYNVDSGNRETVVERKRYVRSMH